MAYSPGLAVKDACTGCAACAAVCPKGAISMRSDFFGFMLPRVNRTKCVACRKCEQICPVLHPFERDESARYFAARTTNAALLSVSTSGGIFSELASAVIEKGGCVFGCVFDAASKRVFHRKADTLKGLSAMRGSKYVQSDIRDVFKEVKDELSAGKTVLFSGTPCQVAAIRRFAGDADHLITVDLFCHGVPSPLFFRSYLEGIEAKAGSKLKGMRFRDKTEVWSKGGHLVFEFEDENRNFRELASKNIYFNIFAWLDGIGSCSDRASCYQCVHRCGASGADVTIADFWGIEKVSSAFNDERGVSAVVVHTEKGRSLFDACPSIESEPVTLSQMTAVNSAYLYSDTRQPYWMLFQLMLKYLSPARAVVAMRICLLCSPRRIARRILPFKLRSALLNIARKLRRLV